MEWVLASGSPRRVELMKVIRPDFTVAPSDADETIAPGTPPDATVRELARRKASAVAARYPDALVVGADTVVALDGLILGKPRDREDAARMLRLLSGRRHAVFTGVCLLSPAGEDVFCQRTDVEFYPLSENAVQWYLGTGEPFDKAGAYGIQQKGALLVRRVEGDYFNVMGFPLAETARRISHLTGREC